MEVTQKLKTHFKIIAALCIALSGGITIWSCSQDELGENGQSVYRYTAEEIATLKTLAEEYGIPDVTFDRMSETELPSIKEMEKVFKEMACIIQALSAPMEIKDSTLTSFIYSSAKSNTPRIKYKRASGGEISYSDDVFVNYHYTTIYLYVFWSRDEVTNKVNIYVKGKIDLPIGYEARNVIINYPVTPSSSSVSVTYKCDLCYLDRNGNEIYVPFSYSTSISTPFS